MTRSVLSVLTALVLLAAPIPMLGEVQVNESTDFTMSVYVPCADEVVLLSGRLHTLLTYTINGNNVSGKYHFQPQNLQGVGMTSGMKYVGTGVTQSTFKGSLQSGQYNQQYVNNFRIVGQGPGNNFLVHETMHITINANGEVVVTHDNFSTECK